MELANQGGHAQPGARLCIPMPGTADDEARMLVQVLYSQRPESMLQRSQLSELLALASVCNRYALEELLRMIDQALVDRCGAQRSKALFAPGSSSCLDEKNALSCYCEAWDRGLPRFQQECAWYIAEHAAALAPHSCADLMGALLKEMVQQSGKQQRGQGDRVMVWLPGG